MIIDHGHLVVAGQVDELATSGPRRLVVRIEGERSASWLDGVAGVEISEVRGGDARLVLDPTVDSNAILELARSTGRVTKFVFERRRLSELFREAVA